MLSRRQQGPGYYDRFKGRVLFSIRDAQGRPVGIGGRVLPELATGDRPSTSIRPRRRCSPRASCSTASTWPARRCARPHGAGDGGLHRLHRGPSVRLRQRGGRAGHGVGRGARATAAAVRRSVPWCWCSTATRRAASRANEVLELFVASNVDLRMLTLPEELDPSDFLLKHGAEAFRTAGRSSGRRLGARLSLRRPRASTCERDVHRAGQALEQLVATIAKAPRLRDDTQVDDRLREEQILAAAGRPSSACRRSRCGELMTQPSAQGRPRAPRPSEYRHVLACRQPVDPLERELLEIVAALSRS